MNNRLLQFFFFIGKDIIFNCGLSKEIAEFKSVKLEVEKGFLGYAIIKNKELIE